MVERIDRVFHENGIRCSVPVPGLHADARRARGSRLRDGRRHQRRDGRDASGACRARYRALSAACLRLRFGAAPEARARHRAMPFPKRSACRPSEIVVIGDNPHDIEMARKRRRRRGDRRADRQQRPRGSRAARRRGARQRARSSGLAARRTPLNAEASRSEAIREPAPPDRERHQRRGAARSRAEALELEAR